MTNFTTLTVTDHNHVRTLTISRPQQLNALSTVGLQELRAALLEADQDADVRVVVLTGEGRAFCAGANISGEALASYTEHLQQNFNPLILTMRQLSKPLIAAVNGVAAGAGASLALACDVRVAANTASFIQLFSNIALIPDSGSAYFLPRLVGQARAFELMALADRLSADEALRLGVCQAVFASEDFAALVQEYAERYATRPAHALALTKKLLEAASTLDLAQTLELEAQWQQRAADHWEHAEGLRAFAQKRPPQYRQQPPSDG